MATPRGFASNTGRISNVLLEALQEDNDIHVTTLDLFSADLPAVAGTNIKTKYALMTGQAIDEAQRLSWNEIERTIEGFLAADIYLLTVPMWNFGIPYALKYYIDAIVQPGYLFKYDETGQAVPLVHGRKMICVTSRGGDYSGERSPFDFVESYFERSSASSASPTSTSSTPSRWTSRGTCGPARSERSSPMSGRTPRAGAGTSRPKTRATDPALVSSPPSSTSSRELRLAQSSD